MSIASYRNIFEIDGMVEELGYDYLHRVPRSDVIIKTRVQGEQSRGVTSITDEFGHI